MNFSPISGFVSISAAISFVQFRQNHIFISETERMIDNAKRSAAAVVAAALSSTSVEMVVGSRSAL
jgi:hypothetical protein